MAERHGQVNGSGHEQRDINLRVVGLSLAGLAALTGAAALFLWLFHGELAEQRRAEQPRPSPVAAARPAQPPEPRLQPQPAQDLEQMRREEEERLTSYGWVDREGGTVRLPIERALELLAERGLPARESAGEGESERSE